MPCAPSGVNRNKRRGRRRRRWWYTYRSLEKKPAGIRLNIFVVVGSLKILLNVRYILVIKKNVEINRIPFVVK
jgi:hypothetical protein